MTTRDVTRRMLAGGLVFQLALGGAASTPAQQFGFRSLGAAEDAAARIMDASGLRADFEIVVDEGSDNAAAGIIYPCEQPGACTGYRVIVYDPRFLLHIEQETDEWGPISIMAHEVAHHLQGHTVFAAGSNPPNEIDADFYSGFILQRLGASLESAQAAMRVVASERGSSSHPPRRERLQAIAMGWRDAAARGGAGGAGEALEAARAELEEMRAELRRLGGRLQESEDRANEAEAERDVAEAERDAAEEALRDVQARGGAAEAEIHAAESRVRDANARVRAAESEIEEAQAARAAAEEALVAAEERARFGEQAAVTADRAFLLTVLLVPLVLAALVLALRKPRREVAGAVDRASRVFRGLLHREPDGGIVRPGSFPPAGPHPPAGSGSAFAVAPKPVVVRPEPSSAPDPSPELRGRVLPAPDGRVRRRPVVPPGASVVPGPPMAPALSWPAPAAAPTFDGSGLEQCAEPGGFVLGRDEMLVDAVLDHRSVSHRHARLTRLDGRLCVEDLNSTNGTRVNGRRLEPFAPRALAPGDTVVLGDVDLPLRLA